MYVSLPSKIESCRCVFVVTETPSPSEKVCSETRGECSVSFIATWPCCGEVRIVPHCPQKCAWSGYCDPQNEQDRIKTSEACCVKRKQYFFPSLYIHTIQVRTEYHYIKYVEFRKFHVHCIFSFLWFRNFRLRTVFFPLSISSLLRRLLHSVTR